MRIRVGRRNGHTLYVQDGLEPSDADDFIGSCVSPAAAALVVEMVNRGMGVTTPFTDEQWEAAFNAYDRAEIAGASGADRVRAVLHAAALNSGRPA